MANIFSKRPEGHPRKILIILVIILAAILLLGIAVYAYLLKDGAEINNSDQNSEQEGNVLEPGLFVCADKCGDGVCQASDPECKDSMNCVCPENQQECPQDCK